MILLHVYLYMRTLEFMAPIIILDIIESTTFVSTLSTTT